MQSSQVGVIPAVDLVAVFDGTGRCVEVSESVSALLRTERDALLGRAACDWFAAEDADTLNFLRRGTSDPGRLYVASRTFDLPKAGKE